MSMAQFLGIVAGVTFVLIALATAGVQVGATKQSREGRGEFDDEQPLHVVAGRPTW